MTKVAPGASWMPIGELSRRLGVSSDLLRKWERRYGILTPGRTIGNQRLYSHVDEARLRLMVSHVRTGVPPAQAAELAAAARFQIKPSSFSTAAVRQAAEAREKMLAALERYEETNAEQVLEETLRTASATAVIRDVFLPLLREVGDRWAHGRLAVAQEHFATGFVHSRLLGLARGWDRGLGSRALLACPPGEQHSLGLIAFGIALHQVGWRITYLGADTPPEMVAQAAESIAPRLIVMCAVVPERLDPLHSELRRVSARWPLALAGAGSSAGLAESCGARHVPQDPVTAAAAIFT